MNYDSKVTMSIANIILFEQRLMISELRLRCGEASALSTHNGVLLPNKY